MPKKKEAVEVEVCEECVAPKIELITQEFGNGEMNILRDKINEIIKSR